MKRTTNTRPKYKNKTALNFKSLRLGYGDTQVLHIEELKIGTSQVTGLLGPSGCGKSSLLNVISGFEENNPAFWFEGSIHFTDRNIFKPENRGLRKKSFVMLQQRSRFYGGTTLECFLSSNQPQNLSLEEAIKAVHKMTAPLGLWNLFEPLLEKPVLELSLGFHKLIYISKLLVSKPAFLLLDEPFRDFAISEEPILIKLIEKIKSSVGILIVTHNKNYAEQICDDIVLLSGGGLVEKTSCKVFFNKPTTDLGQRFLSSGSAWPSENEIEKNNYPPHDSETTLFKKGFPRLSSFYWIIPGTIGGMQKPGLLSDEEEDIRRLSAINVDFLVSLTMKPVELWKYRGSKIIGLHFPIKDMGAPEVKATYLFFSSLIPQLKKGKSAIFHCKAGIGRTGTMLACYLIMEGNTAPKSIEIVRSIFFRYIQSDEQIDFLHEFADYVKSIRTGSLKLNRVG